MRGHHSRGTVRADRGVAVRTGSETLLIPYRIHNDEPDPAQLAGLAPRAQLIARCVYTRHHDGYIRERNLQPVLAATCDWVAPYIVQLAGEYVVEITRTIQAALSQLAVPGSAQHATYGRFAAQNPAFIERTCARAISYWNEHYRRQCPSLASYPARKFLTDLKAAGNAYAAANPGDVPTASQNPPSQTRRDR
jgi:hypothetical protein